MTVAPTAFLSDLQGGTVLLAGAGRMGGALLDAWLASGLAAHRIGVVEPQPSDDLVSRLSQAGVPLRSPGGEQAPADVLVLAIKPQMLGAASADLQGFVGPDTLLLSILAGKTIADLRRVFPQVGAVARAMPNTPAAIRRGITGVAIETKTTNTQRSAIQSLLGAVGCVEWLDDENLIDAVTAVSGSGPAYVFYLAECLAQAGQAAGLDAAIAMRLARATIEGAGALMEAQPSELVSQLRVNVTSPGGTTAAALDVLMHDNALPGLMQAAVAAAKRRAAELSG